LVSVALEGDAEVPAVTGDDPLALGAECEGVDTEGVGAATSWVRGGVGDVFGTTGNTLSDCFVDLVSFTLGFSSLSLVSTKVGSETKYAYLKKYELNCVI
jgi:hypothetical protein